MSQSFQVIHGADDIDLNQHAVIEASAGTGKTYTMVELVIRLMSDETAGIPLDKILLTTFTDNAANELKSRIRKELKSRISAGGLTKNVTNRFNKALQNIESAPIYTIHGFCQRMAAEFAFESGEVFDRELVDGDRIREDRFNAFVRTWPGNPDLKTAFQDYLTANNSNSLSRLKTTVLEVARQSNPDFDVIFPPQPEPLPDLKDFTLLADIENLEQQFLNLLTNKNGEPNAYMQKNWTLKVKPVLEKLSQEDITHEHKQQFLIDHINNDMAGKSCFKYFFSNVKKVYEDDSWDNNKKQNPVIGEQLEQLFGLINQIHANQMFRQAAIIKLSLDHLDKDTSDYLSIQGQVTYDRIIRNLFNLLRQERHSSHCLLIHAIRDQFSVVMIDEFQDTDPYQWLIFKWLFLDSPNASHRLWVIGDPKQSIYGFRGADVNTYLKARSVIQKNGANSYRLNTNYRSIAPLITAFNHFFTAQQLPDSPGYWYSEDSIYVDAADRQKHPQLPRLVQDNSGLSAFNYMPLDEDNAADARRTELADIIVSIIENHLVGRIEFASGNQIKLLNYNDICILVRANNDSTIIKKACQSLNIPVSIQRSQGLYQQAEAIEFEIILSALHQPHDSGRVHNALSSLFFNHSCAKPEQLSETQKRELNQQWRQLLAWAKSGDWVAVFDWLIEGSGTRLRAEKIGHKRQLANLNKIANTLCRYAMKSHADRAELLRFYKKLRLTAHEQDQDHQNQDTDHQAVRVMTMHGAKGLEFPVVFVFDGLTPPSKNKPYHKFYDSGHEATVYDVSKNSGDLQDETNHKEFKQLYYVAMTRAIYKLFLPYAETSGLSVDYRQLITSNIHRCQQADIEKTSRPFSTASADTPGQTLFNTDEVIHHLVPFSQSPTQLSARSRFIHSFSSLSQHVIQQEEPGEQRRYGEDETVNDEPISDELIVTETPLIPGGVTTGHVLHGIFEHVNFSGVIAHQNLMSLWSDDSIMTVVDQQMSLYKMSNQNISSANTERTQAVDYRQQMAAWIWHTLKKPLPMLKGRSLGIIDIRDRRHEMSFHWQHQGQTLTGYIDLLFRIENEQGGDDYYILDWKSNLNAEGYAPDVLAETVMKQHHYDLQFQLYAAAVEAWFQHLNLPKARLKGALYAFSRGIDCYSDELQGIYYHEFTDLAEQNKQTGQHINSLIGGASA